MNQDLTKKIRSLFEQLGAARLERLDATRTPEVVVERIADALASNLPPETAHAIGFHMADWNSDAAFIVALLLFPEQFDAKEIAQGVEGFLIHAPNHIAAAAKLVGCPVQDIFSVGALSHA